MSLQIRPITPTDIPVVEQLAYDYNCELEPFETEKEAVSRWIASVADETKKDSHFFWLACVEEAIVGFVSFQVRTNPFMQET